MELSDHDISSLVEQSASGDSDSCKRLYEHLVEKVYSYVQYRTVTKEQATDLTQDVFIDFFSTLSAFTYQSRAQLYAYVFVITKRKLARHYAGTTDKGVVTEFDEETMSASNNPLALQTEVSGDVAQALKQLDEQTRDIVILHHWSRYTFGEIALQLELKESAVRVRHHRALKTLAELLE